MVDPEPPEPDGGSSDPERLAVGTERRWAGRRGLAATVLVALLVAAIAVGVERSGGVGLLRSRLPTSVQSRWSTDVEGIGGIGDADGRFVAVGDRTVVVRTSGAVQGFDIGTGERTWVHVSRLDPDSFASGGLVVGGIVVVVETPAEAGRRAVAYDATSGEQRWVRDIGDGRDVVVVEGHAFDIRGGAADDGEPFEVVTIDSSTGRDSSPLLELAEMRPIWPFLPVAASSFAEVDDDTGDGVVLYDVSTGRTVGPAVRVTGSLVTAPVGDALVAATDDGVVTLVDVAGTTIDEFDADLDSVPSITWLAAAPGRDLVVVGSTRESVGLSVGGGTIVERWRVAGTITEVVESDGGALRALVLEEAEPPAMVDAATGEVVHRLDSPPRGTFGFDRDWARLVSNGLVHRVDTGLRAVGSDGEELWTLDGDVAWFEVGDGVLVTVFGDTITLHR